MKINSRILAAQSAVMGGAIFIGAQLRQYSWNLPYLLTMLILIVAAWIYVQSERHHAVCRKRKKAQEN